MLNCSNDTFNYLCETLGAQLVKAVEVKEEIYVIDRVLEYGILHRGIYYSCDRVLLPLYVLKIALFEFFNIIELDPTPCSIDRFITLGEIARCNLSDYSDIYLFHRTPLVRFIK